MTTLPKEIRDELENEAAKRWPIVPNKPMSFSFGTTKRHCFVLGGLHIAGQLHTLQQENERLRKALSQIVVLRYPLNEGDLQSWRETARTIANAALTAQSEADNQQK